MGDARVVLQGAYGYDPTVWVDAATAFPVNAAIGRPEAPFHEMLAKIDRRFAKHIVKHLGGLFVGDVDAFKSL